MPWLSKNTIASVVTVIPAIYLAFVGVDMWVGHLTFWDNFKEKVLPMLTAENLAWVCFLGGILTLAWINFGGQIRNLLGWPETEPGTTSESMTSESSTNGIGEIEAPKDKSASHDISLQETKRQISHIAMAASDILIVAQGASLLASSPSLPIIVEMNADLSSLRAKSEDAEHYIRRLIEIAGYWPTNMVIIPFTQR
ncbi:hypothetical protein [Geminicoccus harenae]|uniref:hypothetical protein n=1 Tax=Geminicoccus harenae TaxID=2498453 RepID=UPI00168A6DAE|nr:hypothetical protein [Geminicoccus harenae]